MTSPYQPPQHFDPPPSASSAAAGLAWRSVLIWALGLRLLMVLLSSVVTYAALTLFRVTPEDLSEPFGAFQRVHLIVVGAAKSTMFAVLGARPHASPARDIAAVLLVYLLVDTAVSALFLDGSLLVLAVWSWLPSLVSAALGYGLAKALVPRGSR